jgi:RNA polymerase sigma-70 factor (ECF subfamily)
VVASDDAGIQVLEWVSDRDLLLFVERLPPSQRDVLALRFLLDMTTAEIAAMLGRTPEAVRVLQHRALTMLRKRLTALGRGPRDRTRSGVRRCPDQAPVLRMRRFALLRS